MMMRELSVVDASFDPKGALSAACMAKGWRLGKDIPIVHVRPTLSRLEHAPENVVAREVAVPHAHLFSRLPALCDLNQETIANCWLLAALGSILQTPGGAALINQSMLDAGDHVYVRLFVPDPTLTMNSAALEAYLEVAQDAYQCDPTNGALKKAIEAAMNRLYAAGGQEIPVEHLIPVCVVLEKSILTYYQTVPASGLGRLFGKKQEVVASFTAHSAYDPENCWPIFIEKAFTYLLSQGAHGHFEVAREAQYSNLEWGCSGGALAALTGIPYHGHAVYYISNIRHYSVGYGARMTEQRLEASHKIATPAAGAAADEAEHMAAHAREVALLDEAPDDTLTFLFVTGSPSVWNFMRDAARAHIRPPLELSRAQQTQIFGLTDPEGAYRNLKLFFQQGGLSFEAFNERCRGLAKRSVRIEHLMNFFQSTMPFLSPAHLAALRQWLITCNLSGKRGTGIYTRDQLTVLQVIRDYTYAGLPIAADTQQAPPGASASAGHAGELLKKGLVFGHAYSVLGAAGMGFSAEGRQIW